MGDGHIHANRQEAYCHARPRTQGAPRGNSVRYPSPEGVSRFGKGGSGEGGGRMIIFPTVSNRREVAWAGRKGGIVEPRLRNIGGQQHMVVSPAGNRWHVAVGGVVSLPANRSTVVHGRFRGPIVASLPQATRIPLKTGLSREKFVFCTVSEQTANLVSQPPGR